MLNNQTNEIDVNSLETLETFLKAKDNTISHKFIKNIPDICKSEPCILGIDEAGRGPVLGPMVYGIAFCPLIKKEILNELGCADSKQLTEEKREIIFEQINQNDEAKSSIGWAIDIISPNIISSSMFRRTKFSLNDISMDSAINLIRLALNSDVNIKEIYVDTVGPPDKYEIKLKKLFPQISKIIVAKKADSTYPIVSAASIFAKVTRDHALKIWNFKESIHFTNNNEFGSGYPNDPITKRFLSENIDPVFGYPKLVRFSWSTIETALNGKAFNVEFDDPSNAQQTNNEQISYTFLNYFKRQTKDGIVKKEKSSFFKERCLESTTQFP